MPTDAITRQIHRALTAAGLNPRGGVARTVLDTVQNALQGARWRAGSPQRATGAPDADDLDVIDGQARWLDEPAANEPGVIEPAVDAPVVDEPAADAPADNEPAVSERPARPGRFLAFEHQGPLGTRAYKLYVPSTYHADEPMPLVVMLHGCKQDPDDFARGTRMNEVAEEAGLLVAYPAQSRRANGANCWQWFEPEHQRRAGAEPSIVVGIVREIQQAYSVDERRVYVAGLSAGAAMANILGDRYPDVFAAVAAHSGLPSGAAHDVASAFAAMRGMGTVTRGAEDESTSEGARAVPTIVFHGEADHTVVPANGAAVVARAVDRLEAARGPLTREVTQRACHGGACVQITHSDRDGTPVVEHWSVPGAGHAWFGGSSDGSFAGPHGPDASREAVRFFARHARA